MLTLFFLSNQVPFNGQSFQKLKGSGTRDLLLFRLRNKFTKISLLVIYYLTKFDCVIQSGLSYSKHYICKFMQDNSWYYKLFHFRLPFWIWSVKCGKEEQKLQKFEYVENEKSLLDEIKTFFIVFQGLSLLKKYKFDKN